MKNQQASRSLLLLLLWCWAVGLQQHVSTAAAWKSGSPPPAFSASLLYIYATDSIYWPQLTGKLLRDNDTLLILPGMVYKVWCEVQPDGRPTIKSSRPGVISHQPLPLKTMAHVELHRNLFSALSSLDVGSGQAKLWCEYSDGTSKQRTEVVLKPFSAANTTCNYTTVNDLVAEGSMVNFTCTSWAGYPRPEHSCAIVTDEGEAAAAQVVSIARPYEDQVVTTFAVLASHGTNNASLECRTSQQVAFKDSGRSFKESLAQRVQPLGRTGFAFMSKSTKRCEMTLTGVKGATVVCQSTGGRPETDHSCWVGLAGGSFEALPLMAKVEDANYVTEATLNSSWAHQSATVTCVLQQRSHYSQKFSFRVPDLEKSSGRCHFSQQYEGLQSRCFSGVGFPPSEHSCAIRLDNRTIELSATEATKENGTLMSSYLVPHDSEYRGSQLVCTISQAGFRPSVYLHSIPQFTESHKACRFISSSGEVRAVCEFSAGYPATHTHCELLVANSTVRLTLPPDREGDHAAARRRSLRTTSYTVRLTGPRHSHAGGSIVCRVFQGSLFAAAFAHRIPAYQTTTSGLEPRAMSSQTVLTLSLGLLAALLLVLLMSLPVRAARRCLGRSGRKDGGGGASAAASSVPFVAPPVGGGVYPQPQDPAGQGWLLQGVGGSRGYRVSSRGAGMPEIDQYSMFELGRELDPGNKRRSVLVDVLLRCHAEQSRRNIRFSV